MHNDEAALDGQWTPAAGGPEESSPAEKIGKWEMFLGLLISPALLIPCFWHRHIQAGDLASHVYNA